MDAEGSRALALVGWATSSLVRRRGRTLAVGGGLVMGVALIAAVVWPLGSRTPALA